ncbi:cobalamin biosynthesis protein [Methylobacterium nodulans]|uniref:cobalamin biosynthesis protein n=1 Tax=Methylobacterium nodulans TaxID=114616 RepID=UPI0002EA396C|nr:cobalamin biosynthesis protein [Methylobacterium nodulans]
MPDGMSGAASGSDPAGTDVSAVPARGPVIAGVGFRHATTPDEIAALVRDALGQARLAGARLGGLATAEDRAGEAALQEAAASLGVPVIGIAVEDLRAAGRRAVTRSARIETLRGVGSLAEAAALAAAGPEGRLVLARIASPGATCALAASGDPS